MIGRMLVGCARSGILGAAFRSLGWEAYECDTEPTRDSGNERWHLHGDVLEIAAAAPRFDLFICHPPCQFLSVSGLHWNKRRAGRAEETRNAIRFFLDCAALPFDYMALENPVGCISTSWRRPDQIIQPYQFGEDASKATCLWLKGLPALHPTLYVEPRIVNGKKRWSNQTDSGQNRLGPSNDRAEIRARTYPGIAAAMAQQWTDYLR